MAHPDWSSPAPFVLWMHGRTAYKELDPGRYNRWLRAGIAVCAIDLPGHGEREDERFQQPTHSLRVIRQALGEVDDVINAVEDASFDKSRMALGGMSMGGMVTLRRLCEPHSFRCAAVEGTTGDLERLYSPLPKDNAEPWPVAHDRDDVSDLSAKTHLDGFEPLPMLALHTEADEMVHWPGQRDFLDSLREHYEARGADPSLVEVKTWPETGAPFEHVGFGSRSNDAKVTQTDFLSTHLGVS